MENQSIALDLKAARRKAGLLQADCAHLIGVHPSRISLIENGRARPSLFEIATLSVVYGKPIESLLAPLMEDVIRCLVDRLASLPAAPKGRRGTFNRAHTLSQLAIRLEKLTDGGYGV